MQIFRFFLLRSVLMRWYRQDNPRRCGLLSFYHGFLRYQELRLESTGGWSETPITILGIEAAPNVFDDVVFLESPELVRVKA